ncbi:MAG TPA: glycosyltransferase family 4 protein [Chloroflexota bacterium]|nr:glycosyltransferase family 4 protein [Chloroflexota bacterium]
MHSLRVLALHWDDVCSPWRIATPLGALRRAGVDARDASIHRPPDLAGVDVLVLHRPNSAGALDLLGRARERGIATVVDVDDLFLLDHLPPLAPFSRAWHPLFERREAEARVAAGIDPSEAIASAPLNQVLERFRACLATADAVTVSTDTLAAAYAPFNPDIHVLPNCFDDADPLWSSTSPASPTRQTVNIGFAGTDHHVESLELLRDALEPVLRRHAHARIVEGGGPALIPLVNAPPEQLVHLGQLPFVTFPLLLRQMDIVLAPLADGLFWRCKSNIRAMTAGLVGLPVVASPAGPYAGYVEHGVNGFHARTAADWTASLDQLVADPTLRRRLGEANRRRALDYAISRHAHRWIDLYERLLSRRRRA